MSLLETWVATPLAGAVGWTLLHSLWEGALIASVLAVTLAAARSPRVRYAAACFAMLLMLAGFALTLLRLLPEPGTGTRISAIPVSPLGHVAGNASATVPSAIAWTALVPWMEIGRAHV